MRRTRLILALLIVAASLSLTACTNPTGPQSPNKDVSSSKI